MKWVLVACLALGIGGTVVSCVTAEKAAGITRDKDGNPVSDGTGGVLGWLLGKVLPGGAAVVAGLAGTYAEVKRRQWKEAAITTYKGVEKFAEENHDAGEVVKKTLKQFHSKTPKVAAFVKGAIDKFVNTPKVETTKIELPNDPKS